MKFAKTVILTAISAFAMVAGAQLFADEKTNEPKRATINRAAPVRAVAAQNQQNVAAAIRASDTQAAIAANVKGLQINARQLETHQMRPAHIVGAVSDEGFDEKDAAGPVRALIARSKRATAGASAKMIEREISAMPKDASSAAKLQLRSKRAVKRAPSGLDDLAAPPEPYLDVGAFGQAFHAAIKDNVVGYALRIGKNGQTIYTLQWNWAQTPSDSSLGWSPQRRMHVASISKLITGMAMVRLLNEKGVSYDAKIINYLPGYWPKGSNISKITFRHLLTHTSGFSTGGSSSDYQFMKSRVASGVPASAIGTRDYENMNFGLCRILIAVINGNINKNAVFPAFINDQLWDAITINAYVQYVNQKVFAPAGVSGPSLDKPDAPARAYMFPAGNGWNSGNLASMAGGAAWHMSINEILAVMHIFRRANAIVSPSKAQEALDAGFGVDRIIATPAGKLYDKNGRWRDGNQRTEQSVAAFMPEGMDIVVFVNSPIGPNAASLRNLVRDAYLASVVEP